MRLPLAFAEDLDRQLAQVGHVVGGRLGLLLEEEPGVSKPVGAVEAAVLDGGLPRLAEDRLHGLRSGPKGQSHLFVSLLFLSGVALAALALAFGILASGLPPSGGLTPGVSWLIAAAGNPGRDSPGMGVLQGPMESISMASDSEQSSAVTSRFGRLRENPYTFGISSQMHVYS